MLLHGNVRYIYTVCLLLFVHEAIGKKSKPSAAISRHNRAVSGLSTRVRVLLDTKLFPYIDPVLLKNKGTAFVVSNITGTSKRHIKKNALAVQVKKNILYVDGRKYKEKQVRVSAPGHITYGDNKYSGSFIFVISNGQLLVINDLPLEQYICSVLRTESWPGWPLEVNKVFAITSRTYVISMMQEAKKVKRPYHVHNCNKHQTYSGVHDTKILQDAVRQTKGIILTYKNKPIIAMFDSCCGGVIPAYIQDVNFNDAPYLARNYACKHCKRCWIYNWKAEYSLDELHKHLFKQVGPVSNIRNLRVTKKDKAGLVQEVTVDGRKKILLEGKKLYTLLKDVKSFCYTITKKKKSIIVHGRGYGHHLGLCQWGAREMVRDGWDYRKILQFYFPQTQFMRIN